MSKAVNRAPAAFVLKEPAPRHLPQRVADADTGSSWQPDASLLCLLNHTAAGLSPTLGTYLPSPPGGLTITFKVEVTTWDSPWCKTGLRTPISPSKR